MKTPMQQIKDVIDNANWDSPSCNEQIVNWIDDHISELLLTETNAINTPLQEFYQFMEQNQYFIGNDLYAKYHELINKNESNIRI